MKHLKECIEEDLSDLASDLKSNGQSDRMGSYITYKEQTEAGLRVCRNPEGKIKKENDQNEREQHNREELDGE